MTTCLPPILCKAYWGGETYLLGIKLSTSMSTHLSTLGIPGTVNSSVHWTMWLQNQGMPSRFPTVPLRRKASLCTLGHVVQPLMAPEEGNGNPPLTASSLGSPSWSHHGIMYVLLEFEKHDLSGHCERRTVQVYFFQVLLLLKPCLSPST